MRIHLADILLNGVNWHCPSRLHKQRVNVEADYVEADNVEADNLEGDNLEGERYVLTQTVAVHLIRFR